MRQAPFRQSCWLVPFRCVNFLDTGREEMHAGSIGNASKD
jgi:hypothetical protein